MFSADQNHPSLTYKSPQNGATTRIDAIFTSSNFPFTPLYYHTRKSFLYLTDHLIVAAYFQPVESQKERYDKRLKTRSKSFNVASMDDADWNIFHNYSEKYYKDHNFKKHESLPATIPNITLLWTKIKELLITMANKMVPCCYRSSDDSVPKPKALTSCYSALKQLNSVLLQFRTKYLSRDIWPDVTTWVTQMNAIQQICKEHQIDPIDLPSALCANNVRPVKKQLLTVYKIIYQKARMEQRILEHKQIKHNIKLRCTNYDEDLTKMIDSILNREKRCIVLDRLLVKDPVHGNILVTNANTIQQLAVNHFQQYVIPSVPVTHMNERWTN